MLSKYGNACLYKNLSNTFDSSGKILAGQKLTYRLQLNFLTLTFSFQLASVEGFQRFS